jgi:magnesium chelatase family protein
MLDRFDLHIEVPQVAYRELAGSLTGPVCSDLKLAVREARQRQRKRGTTNARLGERDVLAGVPVDRAASRLLTDAQDRWRLSARSVVRILRVARTLADLAGRDEPGVDELSEALHLRRLDRPSSGDTV